MLNIDHKISPLPI